MRELLQIWEAIKDLRRRVSQRPVPILPSFRYRTAGALEGNTLETGQNGIKYAAITSVPSAYDPNVTSTFIDGVGRGVLYINGAAQSGYILILNNDSGSFRNALVNSDIVWLGGPVPIEVSGGGYINGYTVL